MGSERYILKRLLEGVEPDAEMEQELDERTYYAPDGTQYWKRNGKFCKWTEEGGRVEITEEEYQKALASDGVSTKRVNTPTKAEEPINVQGHTINYNHDTKYWDVKDANGKVKMEAMTKEDAVGFAKGEPESKENYTSIEQRRNAFYDDSESDYVSYDGCRDFDHTSWDIDGMETTIKRNPSGRGYYLQNEDFDMDFDTKGDLVNYLRDNVAEFIGNDSENDY